MNRGKIVVLIFLFFYLQETCAQPSEAIVENMRKSVVRIQSGNKVGTGFLWKNQNWVVTTLHLIQNKNNIKVELDNGFRTARIIKVLVRHDLALLQLDAPVGDTNPIFSSVGTSSFNSSIYTMGYNGGGNTGTLIDRTFRLGYSSTGKLEGLLPKSIRDDLNSCKRPDPGIQVLYLEGSLLPGFSGAPIVSNNGKLIGIADGGLDKGASSISWGINASELSRLEISTEAIPTWSACGSGGDATFAADIAFEGKDILYLESGDFLFVKTKTRTIAEMVTTIDDQYGLNQLLQAYSVGNNFDYFNFRYDIYEDIHSGAAFCVPEGSEVTADNGIYKSKYLNGDFTFIAQAQKVTDQQNINPIIKYSPPASAFQQEIIKEDRGNLASYSQDMSMSYANPIIRSDGITVNRLAFRGFKSMYNSYGQYLGNFPQSYSFQTLIGRGSTFLGAAVINDIATIEEINKVNSCINSGQCYNPGLNPQCTAECAVMKLYVTLILGVHMGGFSNNFTP